mmetsp:Transcript_15462/g.55036  ORF Transcript_15462/g.55036 Transcript_15462/m.55036 type:complete len:217 (-) Transcript_15462:435-1085(-)
MDSAGRVLAVGAWAGSAIPRTRPGASRAVAALALVPRRLRACSVPSRLGAMFLLAWLSLPTAGAMTAGTMAARGVVRGAVHVVSAPAPLATGSTVQVVVADYDSAAWGDGRHPTTALCLEWLSGQSWSPGARMLDYGCGTGVLLCAAAMLGCGDVVGVDIDDEILKVARLNVAANDLEGVEITHGRHVVPGAFAPADVVVANILVGALSRPSMVAT